MNDPRGDEDRAHMRRALELARRGWGRVEPNPRVGSVVVRDGRVVGEGYHMEFGGPHAEVRALQAAADRARGADLYVTLEPCHHRGKTSPCSRAVLEAGVRRVVYAVEDPNPEAGGGGRWLREQGVTVESGVCEAVARELNASHFATFMLDRPFVALKYAMSLDARLAETAGGRTEITSGGAIRAAHCLRAGHDAVMVGIGTVLTDDPELTVREWDSPRQAPRRVILDTGLRMPVESRLVSTIAVAPLQVFTGRSAPEERVEQLEAAGVTVTRVDELPSGGLDPVAILSELRRGEVRSVLCEGGGQLGSALLRAGCVDRLYAFVAPRLLGKPGVEAFQGELGPAARSWRLIERQTFGSVTLLVLSAGTIDPEESR